MFERGRCEQYGGIDFLVNNAGIQIADDTARARRRRLRPGARGEPARRVPVRAAGDPATGSTADRRGRIVNVSSVHQVIPKPRFVGYSVSKGGMQNLTHTLALEYAARGIRVNGVGPGATVTPINRAWIDDPVKRAAVECHIPMRRAGDAEEMAAAAAFLLLRRGRLHHRPDAVRRRRADALPVASRPPGRRNEAHASTHRSWCPSRYGADDQAGALNEITPAQRAGRGCGWCARGGSSTSRTCCTTTSRPSPAARSGST